MIYSDQERRWFHAGETGSGASTISILVNSENGNSRIVAQKLDNTREVTVNMNIVKGLKYHQATKTFHQWRDNRTVYGLNFSSEEQAEEFANTLLNILNHVKSQQQLPAEHNYNNNNDSMQSQVSNGYPQNSAQNGMKMGFDENGQNGDLNMAQNGVQHEIQNGIQNGIPNGTQNGLQNGLQNGHQNGVQNGHSYPQHIQDGNSSLISQQTSQMNNDSSNSLSKTEQQMNQISTQLYNAKIEEMSTPQVAPQQQPQTSIPMSSGGPVAPAPPMGGPPAPPPPPPVVVGGPKVGGSANSHRPEMPSSLQDQLKNNNMGNLKPASQRGAPESNSNNSLSNSTLTTNSTVKSKSSGGGNFLDELKRKQAAKISVSGVSRESRDSSSTNTPKNIVSKNSIGGIAGMERNGTPTWKQQNINQSTKTNGNSASPSPSSGNLSGISQSALDKLKSELRKELQEDFRRIIREELAALNKF